MGVPNRARGRTHFNYINYNQIRTRQAGDGMVTTLLNGGFRAAVVVFGQAGRE